jgi:hypothetical protein
MPSWDLKTWVQAGQRTEPVYELGILSVCSHSGQPTSIFAEGLASTGSWSSTSSSSSSSSLGDEDGGMTVASTENLKLQSGHPIFPE